jgi:hypothetical protein
MSVDEINVIVLQKNLAYKKYFRTKNIDNEIEYKPRRVVVKRETRQRHRKLWEQFMSHLESAIYTIKQTTFKLLKHMKQNIKESGNLSSGPRKKYFYIIIRNYGLISVFKKIIGCR